MNLRSIDHALSLCADVLAHRPSGLFTDIDGTISEIAPSPDLAQVDERARRALEALGQRIDHVGAITGRAAIDGSRLLDAPGVLVVGNHGFERLLGTDRWVHPDGLATQESIASAMAELQTWVDQSSSLAGIVLENKGLSASIHYRGVADREHAYRTLLPRVEQEARERNLRMTEGKMVLELRPQASVHKGTALRQLVIDFGLQGVVYLGDDVTDVDGFRALAELRSEGVATAAIAIEATDTDQRVLATADAAIQGVSGCVELLSRLADEPFE